MKKLSLLLALMVLVTITGVYATWSYAGTDDIADAYAESKITITDAVLSGSNGQYIVESNLVLSIDQKNDDHEAELVFAANDGQPIYLKVTFIPATFAGQDIKDHAVPSELYFDTTTDMTYNVDSEGNYDANGTAVDILTFTNESDGRFSPNVDWVKQADGNFTYTMDETALRQQIQLTRTFVLDTKAEHDEFRKALTGNVIVRITDGVVTN